MSTDSPERLRQRPRARSMGDEALVEALLGDGCPMCAHIARIAPQYLDSLLYQHTTDRAYRDRFIKGGGFCSRHVRAAVQADREGNGDGVGGGIFLRSQLAARRRALEGARGLRKAKRLRDAARSAWDCPVCENERSLATAAAQRLVRHAAEDAAWRDAITLAPWCLAHLGELLAVAASDGERSLEPLRQRQLESMREIEERLEALAHDSSHGRRDQLTPAVRTSVKDAADLLAGSDPS